MTATIMLYLTIQLIHVYSSGSCAFQLSILMEGWTMKSHIDNMLQFGSEGKCTCKCTIKKVLLKIMGDNSCVSIHIKIPCFKMCRTSNQTVLFWMFFVFWIDTTSTLLPLSNKSWSCLPSEWICFVLFFLNTYPCLFAINGIT